MLLKSSDFITHDLSVDSVFKGTTNAVAKTSSPPYELELVLRKWYPVDSSREFRCFVRKNGLLGRYKIYYYSIAFLLHRYCRNHAAGYQLLRFSQ